MKYNISKRYVAVAVVGVLAGSLVTIGVAKSAVPHSESGMITACYRTSGSMTDPKGNLRVIDTEANESCENDEVALDWNSQTTGDLMVNKLSNANLEGAHLQYMNLAGVDFHGSQIVDAFLTGSKLDGANFTGATLQTDQFTHVSANNANFTGATVRVIADESVMRNANYSHAAVQSISGADLSGSSFAYAVLSVLQSDNLTNADFRNADITTGQVAFNSVNLTSANFSEVSFQPADLSFSWADLTDADFSGAVFAPQGAVNFVNSTVVNTNFSGASFTNVNFISTDLSDADLTNTTWSNVTCPDTTNSDNNGNTCIGHLTL